MFVDEVFAAGGGGGNSCCSGEEEGERGGGRTDAAAAAAASLPPPPPPPVPRARASLPALPLRSVYRDDLIDVVAAWTDEREWAVP